MRWPLGHAGQLFYATPLLPSLRVPSARAVYVGFIERPMRHEGPGPPILRAVREARLSRRPVSAVFGIGKMPVYAYKRLSAGNHQMGFTR